MLEHLNISDWVIEPVKAGVGRRHATAFDQVHSRYEFTITAHRIRSYYVWKVILPLCLIFATTNMVPVLGYPTLLDMFIVGSTVLVFLALIESLYTSYLVSINRSNTAMQIDRFCRVIFPASYAAIAAAVFIF